MFGTSGGQYMLRGQCVLGGGGAVCAGGQCVPGGGGSVCQTQVSVVAHLQVM